MGSNSRGARPEVIDWTTMPPPRNALERLQARWDDNVEGFQDRIGWLSSRIRSYDIRDTPGQRVVFTPLACTLDEVVEYRAYIVHARMVGFLEEWLAREALDSCDVAEACIRRGDPALP
jgi:hypothetical protein